MTFREALSHSRVLILDGSTGHELIERGVKCPAPLWSAAALLDREALRTLRTLHADYVSAGAHILTANTFRTNVRTLKGADLGHRAKSLTRTAVATAREAVDMTNPSEAIYIAGSVAPVEDCYRPDLVPHESILRDEHRRHIENLYEAKVDLILIETINSIREAVVAVTAAVETELPVCVSFICRNGTELLSGELLHDAAFLAEQFGAEVVCANCSRPEIMGEQLESIGRSTRLPIGAYANLLATNDAPRVSAESYAETAGNWLRKFNIKILGGCCGAGPEHILKLAEVVGKHIKTMR